MKLLCGNIACKNSVLDKCIVDYKDGLVPYVFIGSKKNSCNNCKGFIESKGGRY